MRSYHGDNDFGYVHVHFDLDLRDMTLSQNHDTPLAIGSWKTIL